MSCSENRNLKGLASPNVLAFILHSPSRTGITQSYGRQFELDGPRARAKIGPESNYQLMVKRPSAAKQSQNEVASKRADRVVESAELTAINFNVVFSYGL